MPRLEAGKVLCLKALGAFLYFKFHCLTFAMGELTPAISQAP
jgi:hypothetical protein